MTAEPTLETLLRSIDLERGSIDLTRMGDGRWQAAVLRWHAGAPHSETQPFHSDPVDALRGALIEDERKQRDTERRYAAAPKLGAELAVLPKPYSDCDYCNGTGYFYGDPDLGPCGCQVKLPAPTNDMEDILG